MSQVSVEKVIGILATDEAARRRFTSSPYITLSEMISNGIELTHSEWSALASIDPAELSRFADAINPALQKSDLRGVEG